MKIPQRSISYSDGHIKKRAWVSRPLIKDDAYLVLAQVVDICIENEASLKIPGDLFDVQTPQSRDVHCFMTQMDRMQEAGLPVFAIQGNHDKTSDVPWFVLHKWVTWVDQQIFEPIEGFKMYGLDYRTKTELEEELANVPTEARGIMLHQGAKTILPFENSWDLDEDVLPENIEYVDMGHIHNTHWWEKDGRQHSYPGSPYVTDIDLDPDRYVFMQELVDGKIKVSPIQLKTRGFVTVIIKDGDDIEPKIIEGIKSLEKESWVDDTMLPVMYLKYSTLIEGEVHSVVGRVLEGDLEFFPWFAPCKPEQLELADEKEELVVEDASVDELAHDEADSPELAEFVMLLLRGSASTEFERVRDKIFDDNNKQG